MSARRAPRPEFAGPRTALLTGLLAQLNHEQRRVVLAPPGPLLVLAGAGSGKTLTLAARIAYAVATDRVAPERVLAITFTTRAARELRERIARLAGPEMAARVECATHHAVCNRQLRRHAALIGRSARFSLYDPADTLGLLRRVIADRDLTAQLTPEAAAEGIARAKAGLLSPDELRTLAPGPDGARLAAVWADLEAELEASDALDFDDLLVRSVRLLRADPSVLEQARTRWGLVLVDEFQDTNHPQWAWLELVCAHGNLTAMGDDDQAIYAWRGAKVENILHVDARRPGTRVRLLERNYRSAGAIVRAASRMIETNPGRRPKRMWTSAALGRPIEIEAFLDEHQEADAVADWCASRLHRGVAAAQLAVLFRARRLVGPLSAALTGHGIAHRVLGDRGFLAHAEIRDALAHLQLVANPRDRRAFERAAGTLPGVGAKAIERMLSAAGRLGRDPVSVAVHADECERMTAKAVAALEPWGRSLLAARGDQAISPLGVLVGRILRDSGLTQRLAGGDEAACVRLERLRRLVALAHEQARHEPQARLDEFLAALALAAGEADEDQPTCRVTLATIHAAKGLEWHRVWVCGLEEGTLPAFRALADEDVAEERRLAYVAFTRARDELVLSHVRRRAQRWDLRASRFLAEALGDPVERAA
jgi:DNA helicase II / ATP-dependent DNA helicase PcrA